MNSVERELQPDGLSSLLTPEEMEELAFLDIIDDSPKEIYQEGTLYASKVRKIATRGREYDEVSPDGKVKHRLVAEDDNAFGLLAGVTCPGRTEFCKGCYAEASHVMPGVYRKMKHNTDQLMKAETIEEMEAMLTPMVHRYYEKALRRGTLEDIKEDLIFRIHWDGDFFSEDYARAWARTISFFPQIKFLAFTRSFGYGDNPVNVLPILTDLDNLVLYLSLDEDNVEAGQAAYEIWKPIAGRRLRRAWCAEGYNFARELAAPYMDAVETPPRICPENNRSLPLMKEYRDKGVRGACAICRLCFNGTRDVFFATTGKDHVAIPQQLNVGSLATSHSRPVPVELKPRRPEAKPPQQPLFHHPDELAAQEPLFKTA